MKSTGFAKAMLWLGAIALTAGFASCKKDPKPKPEPTEYTVALTDPDGFTDIVLNDDDTEDFIVGITTDAPSKEDIAVAEKSGKTWCAVDVVSTTQLRVKPGANTSAAEQTATFVVKGGEAGAPLEFTVTRRGTNTVYKLEISGNPAPDNVYETYWTYMLPHTGGVIELTMTTNASRWQLSSPAADEMEDWYRIDRMSGRSGEKMTITVPAATESHMAATLTIESSAGEDSYMITVMHEAPPVPATAVNIYADDWGGQLATNHAVNFAKTGAVEQLFTLEPTPDGGTVEYRVCATGTTTKVADADNWLAVTTGKLYGYGFTLAPKSDNPGAAARSLDLVIMPLNGGTEFFRFKITQAGS